MIQDPQISPSSTTDETTENKRKHISDTWGYNS